MIETLSTRRLSRSFGRTRVLSRIEVTITRGQSVLLVGANGAGKSTLLNLFAGLDVPTDGEVLYDGKPLTLEARRSIGVLGHDSRCYADLSARENLLLYARLCGVAAPEIASAQMVKSLDLEIAEERPARTFSRGMLQRLALGRALIHAPSLLLLDEPFTGLDRTSIEKLRTRLAEERSRGTTFVIISHDFDSVGGLCDRVIGLQRGRLVDLGTLTGGKTHTAAELAALYAGFATD